MGEVVKMIEFESYSADEIDGISEWEIGLPTVDDLPPLSHSLIPPELASAFSISPFPFRTLTDVDRESENTLSSIRGGGISGKLKALTSSDSKPGDNGEQAEEPMAVEAETVAEADVETEENNTDRDGSTKLRRINSEEADSVLRLDNSGEYPSAKTVKRQRLVWTPQLHKRFVEVVAYLGIKKAVPKTIMQLMNVEGLTRENVASHLQKYRLYLKRMQGCSDDDPSPSDHLFASTRVPQNLEESGIGGGGESAGSQGNLNGNGNLPMPIPVHYYPGAGQMVPMPMYGHMGMQMPNNQHPHHQQLNHPLNMSQQRNWSGNNYGPVMTYLPPSHHVPPGDNM